MMMVKLAVYRGKGSIGNAVIRWWKKTKYSHCEIVIEQPSETLGGIQIGYSASLMDGGVRAKAIEFKPGHWEFIDLPWADENKILAHYDKTKHESYGIVDMFWGQVFNRPSNKGGDFCSEWCAAALGIPTPHVHDPASLYALCKFISEKNPH
jgi:hypothetical protein